VSECEQLAAWARRSRMHPLRASLRRFSCSRPPLRASLPPFTRSCRYSRAFLRALAVLRSPPHAPPRLALDEPLRARVRLAARGPKESAESPLTHRLPLEDVPEAAVAAPEAGALLVVEADPLALRRLALLLPPSLHAELGSARSPNCSRPLPGRCIGVERRHGGGQAALVASCRRRCLDFGPGGGRRGGGEGQRMNAHVLDARLLEGWGG
jgi:hypothetical protein